MSSVFSFREERNWDLIGRSRGMGADCRLLACEASIKMFMLVNLPGEGHVVEMPVKQVFSRQVDQELLRFCVRAFASRLR